MPKPLTLSIGEVLWDILPDGKALGGAPSNVGWHASQLGADARVVSAVGDDALGREILDRLTAMGFDTASIAVLSGVPTSTVDAKLDAQGNASYTIHENVAWDRMPVGGDILALAAAARAFNFGSLSQRQELGRAAIHAILDASSPDAVKIFDINLRPPYIDRDILHAGIAKANVIKMNHDEMPVLAELFGWKVSLEDGMRRLLEVYPGVRHLVVTKAEEGAWWLTRERLYRQAPRQKIKPVDTIGAGDSVTASVMMGLLKNWDVQTILEAAMDIASYVCSCRGGTPELPDSLKQAFLAEK